MSGIDFNFFSPTQEDINQATTDNIQFEHGKKYSFMITEVREDVDNEGAPRVIIQTGISSPDNLKGRPHSFFFRANVSGKKQWIGLLRAFFTEEEMLRGVAPTSLIGKQMSSVAKITVKADKTYVNFWTFEGASNVPDVAVDSNDIPF